MEGVSLLGHDSGHDHDIDASGDRDMDELVETIDINLQSHYIRCIHSFIKLHDFVKSEKNVNSSDRLLFPIDGLSTELGRFRVWAGNTGAHRIGKMSLDHRLREVPDVHSEIAELLEELESDLVEAYNVTAFGKSRNVEEWEFSLADDEAGKPDSSMELDTMEKNDFVALVADVSHIITCLYKLFISIRNPPRTKIHKLASIKIPSIFEAWDIQHISNKFPTAPAFLVERLGKANSTRRQLLQYYKNHHDKIARNLHSDPPLTLHVDDLGSEGQGSEVISIALKSQTTVSTIKPKDVVHETGSDAGHSQTSYATSAGSAQHRRVAIPPPPDFESAYDGKPFECPYCYSLVSVDNMRVWKNHVFRDLQPYVCTQENCERDTLFDSQHEWYEHELQFHYKEWYCKPCLLVFSSSGLFREHLNKSHGEVANSGDTNIVALVDLCERTSDPPQRCLLCGENVETNKRRKHLGKHMQEVALFILPNLVDGENDVADYQEANEWQSLSEMSGDDQNMPLGEEYTSIPAHAAFPYPEASSSKYLVPRHPNSPEPDGSMGLGSPGTHAAVENNSISNKSMSESDDNDITGTTDSRSLQFYPQICPECGYSCKYQTELTAHKADHRRSAHIVPQLDMGEDKIIPACCKYPGCVKKFKSKLYLRQHIARRHSSYVCPHEGCLFLSLGHKFNSFNELWEHMRKTHGDGDHDKPQAQQALNQPNAPPFEKTLQQQSTSSTGLGSPKYSGNVNSNNSATTGDAAVSKADTTTTSSKI